MGGGWNDYGFIPEDADELIQLLSKRTEKPESEVAKFQKAIKRLFKYYKHSKGRDYEWEPEHRSDKGNASMSHNYFKKSELSELYNAAIEISSFKSYDNKGMSSQEKNRLKIHLSQCLEKPIFRDMILLFNPYYELVISMCASEMLW